MNQDVVRFLYGSSEAAAQRVGLNNLNYEPNCVAVGYTSLVATLSEQLRTNGILTKVGNDPFIEHELPTSFPTVEDIIKILDAITSGLDPNPPLIIEFTSVGNDGFSIHNNGVEDYRIDPAPGTNNELLMQVLFGIDAVVVHIPFGESAGPFYPNNTLGITDQVLHIEPTNELVIPVIPYGRSTLHCFQNPIRVDLGQNSIVARTTVFIPYVNAQYTLIGNKDAISVVVKK